MNKFVFLIMALLFAVLTPLLFNIRTITEGYTNQIMNSTYPTVENNLLIQDTYPSIGKNELSNDTSNDLWKYYPTFSLGSYDQITNNKRYPTNPDIGTCTPASMCGALYHNNDHLGSNVITPLPPVSDAGTRVGYFTATTEGPL